MIDDLEGTVRDLLQRHAQAGEGSAERRFLRRQLNSLRRTHEAASGIIEEVGLVDDFHELEDERLAGVDGTPADPAIAPISRLAEFRREPNPPSTKRSYPDPIADEEDRIGDARAARERIIDMVYELAVILRPDGDLDKEAEEKILEINRDLCEALGIDESDPL